MKVVLTVLKGPDQGRVMEFVEPRGFIIGRAEDADFRLSPDDPYVGRRHVLLQICPPSCRLQDLGIDGLGSTNPPHVNTVPVADDVELRDGDVLELGYTQFKIGIVASTGVPIVRACRTCGRRVEYLPGEPEPLDCLECADHQQHRRQPQDPSLPVKCSQCETDLTERANSDGRAGDFGRAVVYWCQNCLPPQDRFGGLAIGPYRIVKRLGVGGFGTVYLVYHEPTARALALKQITDIKHLDHVRRFEREMRVMKDLGHQNVVRTLATGIDTRGAPFIVTQYVPGGDLADLMLASGGRLPLDLAVKVIQHVLDGLEYLHGQEIVHRDIKPPNILLSREVRAGGERVVPKITDFGLAKCYARAGGTVRTRPGTGFGTLMYTSPEQIRNARDVRPPADTYSAGVTLYHLLTGRYSFDFPTPQDVLELQNQKPELRKKPRELWRLIMKWHRCRHPFQIILSEDPVPVRQRDASIPTVLAEVVDKAVRKDQTERFRTASEFRSALRQAVA